MEAWLEHCSPAGAAQFGLSTVFVVSFISATLLPMGSEPAVFGVVKLNPALFWPAILVATAGNTLGGAVDWWMGYGAHKVVDKYGIRPPMCGRWPGWSGWAPCLPAVLAAGRGRPAVRRGGLAQVAVLALRWLHADRQVPALPGDDRALLYVFPS
jgi:hypothetical protein